MIHSISANHLSFHTVTFTEGLNIVLAERTATSTEKDTRNGVGKSMLLEILDFCLGSGATKNTGLIINDLDSWAFTLDITLAGQRVKVTRAVNNHNCIIIDGPTNDWIEQPDLDEESGRRVFKVERWRALLGWALFRLPRSKDNLPYNPSYRSLISYFVRRRADAYSSPFRYFPQQKTWNMQINTAYLLGLNWEYAAQWQGLKDREDGIKAIEKAISTGAMEGIVGTVGELETQRIQLEQEANGAKQALDSFKVHPQYESIQRDADRLTKEIHDQTNQNISDRRRLSRYREAVAEEKPPASMSLERLYEESGLIFPDTVHRTLSEAREFHQQIVANRRDFLQTEIDRIQKDINDRESRIKQLTDERSDSMGVLRTHGALQEMTVLQERYVGLEGNLDRIRARLRELKNLKAEKRDVKSARSELVKNAERDHDQRSEVWSEAVRLFNENSQALYERAGKLVIDISGTGYKYHVDIERGGSEGIEKMKIFCFDLVLLQLQRQQSRGIDFLAHDTLMYDAVDARQRARALERVADVTSSLGAQYICTMNSDMVPSEDFSESFNFENYVRLTLTDSTASGSLLGIRFERPKK